MQGKSGQETVAMSSGIGPHATWESGSVQLLPSTIPASALLAV